MTFVRGLGRCRRLLAPHPVPPESVADLMLGLTGVDITRCPVCEQGRLRIVARFRPGALPGPALDTS